MEMTRREAAESDLSSHFAMLRDRVREAESQARDAMNAVHTLSRALDQTDQMTPFSALDIADFRREIDRADKAAAGAEMAADELRALATYLRDGLVKARIDCASLASESPITLLRIN